MNASSRLPHRRGRAATPAKLVGQLTPKPREARRLTPSSERVLLVSWTSVFPLSTGPAERVHRHAAAELGGDDLVHVVASYVRALDERVPGTCTVDADGNLLGPQEFTADAGDVLFRAVFTTDLDAVLGRCRTRDSVPSSSVASE